MDALKREIDGLTDAAMSAVAFVAILSPFALAISALIALFI